MKVKAVIFLRDRNNASVVLRKKDRQNKGFRFGGANYVLDPDRFTLTSRRIVGFKQSFITFYYREGMARPLPVPLFPDIKDNGISTEELNAIFTPAFYRILAGAQKNKQMDILTYLSVGNALIGVYSVYLLTKLPDRIMQLLAPLIGGGT